MGYEFLWSNFDLSVLMSSPDACSFPLAELSASGNERVSGDETNHVTGLACNCACAYCTCYPEQDATS